MNKWFVERTSCPACASTNHATMYAAAYEAKALTEYLQTYYEGRAELEYLEGASFVLKTCGDCEAVFQAEVPGEVLSGRLYEHWISAEVSRSKRERRALRYYAFHAQELMQIIAALNRPPGQLTCLDFGMGWGKWALLVKAFGCVSYGAELSEARVANAQALGIPMVTWDQMPTMRFDFINAAQVFEHLTDPRGTLQHLANSLLPGGLLRLTVPTAHDIRARLRTPDWNAPRDSRQDLHAVAPLEHINLFSRRALRLLGEAAGLRETTIPLRMQYAFATDWRGPVRIAKNLLQPLTRRFLPRQNHVFFERMA